jgi:hypothetical protein
MTFTNGLTELLQGHKIFKNYKAKARILEEDMSEFNEIRDALSIRKIEKLNKNEIKPFNEDLQMMLENIDRFCYSFINLKFFKLFEFSKLKFFTFIFSYQKFNEFNLFNIIFFQLHKL